MITITEVHHLEQIYQYQLGFSAPYFFPTDYQSWEKSFSEDVDGEGRTLFKAVSVKAAYEDEQLVGFVQYGKTAFGFSKREFGALTRTPLSITPSPSISTKKPVLPVKASQETSSVTKL